MIWRPFQRLFNGTTLPKRRKRVGSTTIYVSLAGCFMALSPWSNLRWLQEREHREPQWGGEAGGPLLNENAFFGQILLLHALVLSVQQNTNLIQCFFSLELLVSQGCLCSLGNGKWNWVHNHCNSGEMWRCVWDCTLCAFSLYTITRKKTCKGTQQMCVLSEMCARILSEAPRHSCWRRLRLCCALGNWLRLGQSRRWNPIYPGGNIVHVLRTNNLSFLTDPFKGLLVNYRQKEFKIVGRA